jgi:hypothetical protein
MTVSSRITRRAYTPLVPVVIKGIQEQQKIMLRMEARIAISLPDDANGRSDRRFRFLTMQMGDHIAPGRPLKG